MIENELVKKALLTGKVEIEKFNKKFFKKQSKRFKRLNNAEVLDLHLIKTIQHENYYYELYCFGNNGIKVKSGDINKLKELTLNLTSEFFYIDETKPNKFKKFDLLPNGFVKEYDPDSQIQNIFSKFNNLVFCLYVTFGYENYMKYQSSKVAVGYGKLCPIVKKGTWILPIPDKMIGYEREKASLKKENNNVNKY